MPKAALHRAFLVAALLMPAFAFAAPSGDNDIAVHVDKDGSKFEIRFEFTVDASAQETWDVLTDYQHMAQFLSTVDESTIVKRDGNRIEVAQKSHGNAGPLRLMMDSVRQIDLLPPREIRSHFLKGDLKASDFTTLITPDGAVTRVTGKGTMVLGALGALTIGSDAVETQTRRQYQELRDEILRRKASEPPPACLVTKTCPASPG